MAGGAVVLTGMLVGVIRSDLGFLAAGVSLLLGGIVAWGSDSRTAKEVTKALAVAEKTLIHVSSHKECADLRGAREVRNSRARWRAERAEHLYFRQHT